MSAFVRSINTIYYIPVHVTLGACRARAGSSIVGYVTPCGRLFACCRLNPDFCPYAFVCIHNGKGRMNCCLAAVRSRESCFLPDPVRAITFMPVLMCQYPHGKRKPAVIPLRRMWPPALFRPLPLLAVLRVVICLLSVLWLKCRGD